MAIHTQEIVEMSAASFDKEIEEGAEGVVFNIVQRDQYRFPQRSAIRELASNGLDSVREKNIAKAILSGTAKVEDYYEPQQADAVFKDSGFKPEYYDLNWLSYDDNVEIIYKDGGELGKHYVTIRDYGVGLGGKRLEKSFNLGFSTKRLNKFTLGKFGIGAKSGLSATSTGFYTLTSRYNGEEFVFNVYEHKFESLIPPFDLETAQVNKRYTIRKKDGTDKPYFSRPTTEKNGVEITIPVKKHHKQQYIDAVTSQLLYFPNVRFWIENADGSKLDITVQADILYEDKLIVLSNNNQYSKPHILINGVNYGYLDFREMELEEKFGNIGIKVDAEEVTVNPSRESLIWNDTTREAVVKKFYEVQGIAEGILNTELKETDFIAWLRTCASISARYHTVRNSIISRLSQIVDMQNLELQYPVDKSIRYGKNTFTGIRASVVKLKTERKGSSVERTVEREPYVSGLDISTGLPFILQENSTSTSNKKDKYILMKLYPQGVIKIHLDGDWIDGAITQDMIPENRDDRSARAATVQNYLMQSQNYIKYEDIVVPEGFKGDETETLIEQEDESEEAEISREQRRKLEGKTLVFTPRSVILIVKKEADSKCYEMQKIEMPVTVIDSWNNEEIFYSSQDTEPLLHTAALISRPYTDVCCVSRSSAEYEEWRQKYGYIDESDWNKCPHIHDDYSVRLIRVARENVKYYKDFKHIHKFFREIKKGVVTMSNALIRWNTARVIKERLLELRFLNNFDTISPERAAQYTELHQYVDRYWRDISRYAGKVGAQQDITSQLLKHCESVAQFQLFVRQNPEDTEQIAQVARQLFNPAEGVELKDGCALDLRLYDMYQELLDWAQPVRVMMNELCVLTGYDAYRHEITPELEDEIRRYFTYRNCPL